MSRGSALYAHRLTAVGWFDLAFDLLHWLRARFALGKAMPDIAGMQALGQSWILQHRRLEPVAARTRVRLLTCSALKGVTPWTIWSVSEPLKDRPRNAKIPARPDIGHDPCPRDVRATNALGLSPRFSVSSLFTASRLLWIWSSRRGLDLLD